MLLLVITFTFKLLVKASWTNLCTKQCKKTIRMDFLCVLLLFIDKERNSLCKDYILCLLSLNKIK